MNADPSQLCHWTLISLALAVCPPAIARDGEGEADPDRTGPFPQITLELALQGVGPVVTKVKKGPEPEAQLFDAVRDGNMPTRLTWAWAGYVDVKVLDWAGVGGFFWQWERHWTSRLDGADAHLDGARFDGNSKTRGTLTLRHAEINLRYVWFHTERTYLWFGVGASWFSYRLKLEGQTRSTAKLEAFWAPAWTYSIAGRVPGSKVWVYLTSGVALSPFRFPSVVAHSRLGFRYALTEFLGASLGIAAHNGLISDDRGVTRAQGSSGYRHARARWSVISLELGLQLRY